MTRLDDGRVMFVIESGAAEIDESYLWILEDPGPGFTVGNGLLGVGAIVEQHVLWFQVGMGDSEILQIMDHLKGGTESPDFNNHLII